MVLIVPEGVQPCSCQLRSGLYLRHDNHSLEPCKIFLHDCIPYLQTYLTHKLNAYCTQALQIIASSSIYVRSLLMDSCADVHYLHCPEIKTSLGGAICHLL